MYLNGTRDIGDHSVEVKLSGSHVEGSPFLVKAYNADKVKVTDINSGVVGKPIFFSSKIIFFNFLSNVMNQYYVKYVTFSF